MTQNSSASQDTLIALRDISFSEFREVYRLFFNYLLDTSIEDGILLNEPAAIERYLAEHQADLFEPLINDKAEKFEDFRLYAERQKSGGYKRSVFEGMDLGVIARIREAVADSKPGLIGCHYRSIGLRRLRRSKYRGTDSFWKQASRYSDRNLLHANQVDQEKALKNLLNVYFELFGKAKTVNEQVFNTNHPLGPIGVLYVPDAEAEPYRESLGPSALPLADFTVETGIDLVEALKKPLLTKREAGGRQRFRDHADESFLSICYPFDSTSERPSGLADLKQELALARKNLENELQKRDSNNLWGRLIASFFERKLPRNGLAQETQEILIFLQSYLLYGHLAGYCLYTFPTSTQPNVPTCGFTLMAHKPLRAEVAELLQRITEMIYGDLIAATVISNYRHNFNSRLLASRGAPMSSLTLLGEEKTNTVLASTLADSPIPVDALDTFLAFARTLPRLGVYERDRFSFFLAFVHQEYLESFVDRIPGHRPRRHNGKRRLHEVFYNDGVSIELAGHGMRIDSGARRAPEHLLFFAYPPFDPDYLDLPKPVNSQQTDPLQDAIKNRSAVALTDIVSIHDLLASKRLQDVYLRHYNRRLSGDLEDIAEALTFGNREILVLLYHSNQQMKIYYDGSCLLETKLHHWQLPAQSEDQFYSSLKKRLQDFIPGQRRRFERILTDVIVRFVIESSRRFKGLFLVFHTGPKPRGWHRLDVAESLSGDGETLYDREFDFDEIEQEEESFWRYLREVSASDGAIIFTVRDDKLQVQPKVHVTLDVSEKDHLSAFTMKGYQARGDYPQLRSFGTKHSAAYEYALTDKNGGFAVTVSGDGPVSLFYQETIEDVDFSRRYPEMPDKDWKRVVRIVRM